MDALSTRSIPEIWNVAGKKRILRTDLDFKQKVLLLSYAATDGGVFTEDLFEWTEYSSLSMFKQAVLRPLHDDKLIEYDSEAEIVYISPLGIREVETAILPSTPKS